MTARAEHVQRAVSRPVPDRRGHPAQRGGCGARCGSRLRQRGAPIWDRPAVHRPDPRRGGKGRGSMARAVGPDSADQGTHQWLMAGRLAAAKRRSPWRKGTMPKRPGWPRKPSTSRARSSGPSTSWPRAWSWGRPSWHSANPSVGSTSCTALDGIRRLGHPPTLWRAWWTLGTALAQTGQDDEAAAAAAAAPTRCAPSPPPWPRSGPGRSSRRSPRERSSRPPALARKPPRWTALSPAGRARWVVGA